MKQLREACPTPYTLKPQHAGLGLFEYMQLAEDLGAEPVWVVNNGISHEESVPAGHIQSWVQDALDSIECALSGCIEVGSQPQT
jgi:alpha-L-arabinofuranosidase